VFARIFCENNYWKKDKFKTVRHVCQLKNNDDVIQQKILEMCKSEEDKNISQL
jgi:hypothetical protein